MPTPVTTSQRHTAPVPPLACSSGETLRLPVEEIGRSEWLAEELAAYDNPSLYEERDPREQYHRVKGAGRASSRELAVLRELAAWREQEARRRDRPRSHVLTDETLVYLARHKPQSIEDLRQARGLNAQRDGERILEQIRIGLELPDEECPRRTRRRPHYRLWRRPVLVPP